MAEQSEAVNQYPTDKIPDLFGGQVLIAWMDDGGALCERCVRDETNPVHELGERDGWRVEGWDGSSNYESLTVCDHCGRVLVEDPAPDHHANGYAAGKAAGSWVIDGSTDTETARRLLEGIEAGDPEIMDLQPAPLSGEWAGESMRELLGADEENEEAADAYEAGYEEGFWGEVTRAATVIVGDPEDDQP